MKLFFDTETTGKCEFRLPASDLRQPRIVQLGALLCEDDGEEVGALNVIIRPDGWLIPEEAAAIHGISTAKAERCGIPIAYALDALMAFAQRSDRLIAHNIEFDALVVSGELSRAGSPILLNLAKFCTMKATTELCKLPGPYGYKWPKLTEAHKYLFGADIDGAHDAMVDVRACARIYFEITK